MARIVIAVLAWAGWVQADVTNQIASSGCRDTVGEEFWDSGHNVDCPKGGVLRGFQMIQGNCTAGQMEFESECLSNVVLENCSSYKTSCRVAQNLGNMPDFHSECGAGKGIRLIEFAQCNGGQDNKMAMTFQCCDAYSALGVIGPTQTFHTTPCNHTLTASSTMEALSNFDASCPVHRILTGFRTVSCDSGAGYAMSYSCSLSNPVNTEAPPTYVPTRAPGTYAPLTPFPPTLTPTLPPATNAPSTVAPMTTSPVTNIPSTLAPRTISPPTSPPDTTTNSPVANPSETPGPATNSPSTNSPLTDPPDTLWPATNPPATNTLHTIPPYTFLPTNSPTTNAPQTNAPMTLAVPPSDAPVTTAAPATNSPHTTSPTNPSPPTTSTPMSTPPALNLTPSNSLTSGAMDLHQFAGRLGGSSAVTASSSASLLWVVLSQLNCDGGSTQGDLSFAVHPLGFTIAGNSRAGAIVGNTLLCLGVALFVFVVTLFAACVASMHAGVPFSNCTHDETPSPWVFACSVTRWPSSAFVAVLFLLPGTILCTVSLLQDVADGNDSTATSTIFGVIGMFVCASVPITAFMSSPTRLSAAVAPDGDLPHFLDPIIDTRLPLHQYLFGSSRWVSTDMRTLHAERQSFFLHRHRQLLWLRNKYYLPDLLYLFPVSFAAALHTANWQSCTNKALGLAALFLAHLIFVVGFGAFLAKFRKHIAASIDTCAIVGLLLFAYAYTEEDLSVRAVHIAIWFFTVGIALSFVQAVYDLAGYWWLFWADFAAGKREKRARNVMAYLLERERRVAGMRKRGTWGSSVEVEEMTERRELFVDESDDGGYPPEKGVLRTHSARVMGNRTGSSNPFIERRRSIGLSLASLTPPNAGQDTPILQPGAHPRKSSASSLLYTTRSSNPQSHRDASPTPSHGSIALHHLSSQTVPNAKLQHPLSRTPPHQQTSPHSTGIGLPVTKTDPQRVCTNDASKSVNMEDDLSSIEVYESADEEGSGVEFVGGLAFEPNSPPAGSSNPGRRSTGSNSSSSGGRPSTGEEDRLDKGKAAAGATTPPPVVVRGSRNRRNGAVEHASPMTERRKQMKRATSVPMAASAAELQLDRERSRETAPAAMPPAEVLLQWDAPHHRSSNASGGTTGASRTASPVPARASSRRPSFRLPAAVQGEPLVPTVVPPRVRRRLRRATSVPLGVSAEELQQTNRQRDDTNSNNSDNNNISNNNNSNTIGSNSIAMRRTASSSASPASLVPSPGLRFASAILSRPSGSRRPSFRHPTPTPDDTDLLPPSAPPSSHRRPSFKHPFTTGHRATPNEEPLLRSIPSTELGVQPGSRSNTPVSFLSRTSDKTRWNLYVHDAAE
ncbi:hypothetical protein DIPPA_19769 [Diplonema papillatum]|nr:hypothetical protein DIPPA_19769 [Diplonema papillatum]